MTAEQHVGDARAGPETEHPARGSRRAPIWAYIALLAILAGLIYAFLVAPLVQQHELMLPPIVVLLVLCGAFIAAEWWTVVIHLGQETQRYSLSEIPLVIGLFVVAPDDLVLARVIGAAVGLGILRRQDLQKLAFNLASFTLEAETVTILVHRVAGTTPNPSYPAVWLWVLLFMSLASLLGCALTAGVISLAGGRQSLGQWVQPVAFALIGGFTNCSLGIVVVAFLERQPASPAMLLLLFTPLSAIVASYVLYTREHRLRMQAFHDTITDLANRALFMDRLEHALTRRERHDEALAVMFLDLDDFKTINDSLGHVAGDELLVQVAERLKDVLRVSDTPARFGGDEFAILLEETADPEDTIRVAERIVAVFKKRFVVAGREVSMSASIGVAVTASRDIKAEDLVGQADVAMYRAKVKGKDTFEIFEPGMQDVVARRLEVRTGLERAIDRHELVVLYQPIVDLATSTPVGVEALVRWKHPQWGMVVPSEFIGIAEETGMICELGLHVMEEACRQWQLWQVELVDQPAFTVSVNVSPRQLRDPGFVADVRKILRRGGLHPSDLTLEITESFMVDDPESARSRLRDLKTLGVRISMDDFGTGYSSLASLQDLPLDILKIDKAFVDHIAEDPRRTAFAQAIIRMGKTLGLGLIAEGVETAEQSERLQSLGCRLAQGFYFSRPVTGDEITQMLHASHAMRESGGRWPAADAPETRTWLRVLEETA
jgi:diguanylate cyclase (GGDEF)-like protein